MKNTIVVGFGGFLALLAVNLAAQQRNQTFQGEIMDSPCAAMASHAKMVPKPAITAEDKKHCTLECVKAGGKFVLYDDAAKTVYQLDDQKAAEPFAGEAVTVTGTLDRSNGTILLTGIRRGA